MPAASGGAAGGALVGFFAAFLPCQCFLKCSMARGKPHYKSRQA
ncbi:MAG: hypothetical protein ACK502_10805 [Alphaproteobacteria bacterium]